MGTLSEEILENIYNLLEGIVGEKAVKLIKRKITEKGITEVSQIIFETAQEMGEIIGQPGAYATLREVGRSVARNLMNEHPKEEWEKVFREGLNIMGFAKGVKREGNRACICSCIFYPNFLKERGFKPIKHPVCWIGLGFVEGFMKAFTGAKGVKFLERDFEKEQCWFELVQIQ